MIGKKDVIILDEATSNLDIETRELILETLSTIETYKILIIISHHEEKVNFINKEIILNNFEKEIVS